MPGLVGCINTKKHFTAQEVANACEQMKYYDWYRDDEVFQDPSVIATRTHLNVVGCSTSPYRAGDYLCWIEGEIYNLNQMALRYSWLSVADFPELLVTAYHEDCLNQVLAEIDGYFTAVIYDQALQKLLLITDRLGMKPLFVWDDGEHFAWASELKAFLAFKAFRPEIRAEAVECFMDLGHLLGDVTWFKNVVQLGPSLVTTVDLPRRKITRNRYWSWARIQPIQVTFEEATQVLATLLSKAVDKRVHEFERVGVALSGGLDSRVLMAAVQKPNVPCYTFGQPGALDVEIASRAAAIKGNPHTIFELNESNWLDGRFLSVWKTDGMKSLLHMHYSPFHQDIKELMDINLNGFIGDAVLGGCFLNGQSANRRINSSTAQQWYKKHAALDNPLDDFFSIDKLDPYLINNRCRRHVHLGSVDIAKTVEQRKPLIDNDILEWVYALPEEYRVYSKLYNNSLLDAFPQYFEEIPWQTTGAPIQRSPSLKTQISKKIQNVLRTFGNYQDIRSLIYKSGVMKKTRDYADYPQWINHSETAALFHVLLDPSNAIYPYYTGENYQTKYLLPHLEGKKNYAEQIGRAITLEVWLSRVFGGKTDAQREVLMEKYSS